MFMALLLVLVPMLAKQLVRLYELAPQMLDWLQHVALPWVQGRLGLADGFWKFDKIKAAISEHMGQTTDIVGVVLSQATASSLALIGWLANLVLIPVVGFYLLRDWDLMMAKLRSLLPRQREEQVGLAGECHEVLGAFVRGQLLVMLALGVIYSAGLMLVGLELGLLIGMIAVWRPSCRTWASSSVSARRWWPGCSSLVAICIRCWASSRCSWSGRRWKAWC
jgi:predicted PurR-regulated permease PerM